MPIYEYNVVKVMKELEGIIKPPEDIEAIRKAIIKLTEEIIEVKALVMDLCQNLLDKEL